MKFIDGIKFFYSNRMWFNGIHTFRKKVTHNKGTEQPTFHSKICTPRSIRRKLSI